MKRSHPWLAILGIVSIGYAATLYIRDSVSGRAAKVATRASISATAALHRSAVGTVARAVIENDLDVTADDLRSLGNPKGAGTFVFVPQRRFAGVERQLIWLAIGSTAYPMTGASKNLTPGLPWFREAPAGVRRASGLSPTASTTEAIRIVFGQGGS